MRFEPSTTAESWGKALGFCAMFLVFSSILYLAVNHLWGREWLYLQALAATGAIMLAGELVKRALA